MFHAQVSLTRLNPIWLQVLEYCEDGSLLERLRDEEKSHILVTRLLDYSIQIVKGMRYLEKNGCIHRDLAARNVLLTQHEEVIVVVL